MAATMSGDDLDPTWRSIFPNAVRPELYSSEEPDEHGFQPLTDAQSFHMDLSNLSHDELHTLGSNNQIALRQAQDEWTEITRIINELHGKPGPKNPQALADHATFEEKKEAILYGYKYEPNKPALLHAGHPHNRSADDLTDREKHDVRLFQEPFAQGGFIPNQREFKAMQAKAKDKNNIDGWTPIVKNGKFLIPKQQVHHDEYENVTYVKRIIDENGEVVRPQSAGSDASNAHPIDKRLRRTRFGGKKHPPTRDVSETPSTASTPGRKRANDSVAESREDTPESKRRKLVEIQQASKPKHPNQYTKRKEAAAKAAVDGTGFNGGGVLPVESSPLPSYSDKENGVSRDWSQFSVNELYERKWTDKDLTECIKQRYDWLNPDPAKALKWKQKLLSKSNPVRSLSMYKKWVYWQNANLDKRPRNKNVVAEEPRSKSARPEKRLAADSSATPEMQSGSEHHATPEPQRHLDRSAPSTIFGRTRGGARGMRVTSSSWTPSTTPSTTPAHESTNDAMPRRVSGFDAERSATKRSSGLSLNNLLNPVDPDDASPPAPDRQLADGTQGSVSSSADGDINNGSHYDGPNIQRELSDSTIVVNPTGSRRGRAARDSRGKASSLSRRRASPVRGGASPPRRSARNQRRSSTS